MRVARQIRAHRFWSRERPPGIHHPFIHSHARSGMSHCANKAGSASAAYSPKKHTCRGDMHRRALPETAASVRARAERSRADMQPTAHRLARGPRRDVSVG
jgi:hypothetical protein